MKWSKEKTNGLFRKQKNYTSWHCIWNCLKPTKAWNASEDWNREFYVGSEVKIWLIWNETISHFWQLCSFWHSLYFWRWRPPVLEKLLNEITHNQNLIKVVPILRKFLQAMPRRIWNFLYQRIQFILISRTLCLFMQYVCCSRQAGNCTLSHKNYFDCIINH